MSSPLLCPSRFVLKFLVAVNLGSLAYAEPSTVQIRESSKDRAVTLQTEWDAETLSYFAPFATGQATVTATLGLEGIDVASFDENTRFELVIGRHAIAKRLGDDPKYRKGSTVATFSETTSSPASEEALAATDSRRLQLKWSTKSVRATLSLRSNDLEGAPWAMALAGPMRGESSGKSLSAVIAGHIAFGPQASSGFEIKATGKLVLKRMPQRTPDFEPLTLSSVSLAGSGRGSDRVFVQPGIERISESQVAAAGFSSDGGSVAVRSGSFEGASLTVPSGAFPDGVRIELNETRMVVDKGGKRIELPGLRVSGTAPSPNGAYIDLTLPGMINADGFTLPYGINDDGSLESTEILSADPVSGSVRVRLRVPQSPAVTSDLQPAELTQRAKSTGNATSWDTEFAFLASLKEFGSSWEWFDGNGASGWAEGVKRRWNDFWSEREEPEPEPIETPSWRQAVQDYSSYLSELLPQARVDSWSSKQSAFEAAQSEMRDEEANNQRYFAGTGFVPRTHGFATSSGQSSYLADTSGGMVRFAHWAFREKPRLPLHDLYNYPAEIDFGSKTAQDVIAARASASESGQLAISPWLPGIMRYGQILTSIGVFSKEVPLMVSKVDSNGNFIGVRHLLAYGIGHAAGSEYKPRIVVYDPSAPGAGNRVVRYHPDYGMFYQFLDGSFGVDVRPVAALVPIGPGQTESLSRIYNLAQLGQLNGISEVKNFSIPQRDYVTENPAEVKFDLQDGGEVPVRRLFVNDEPFDVPIEDKVDRGMVVTLDPGPNVLNLKMYGRSNGENLPLHHPYMTANPREVHYLKMPLTVTTIAGDRQSAPEGSSQLRDNLKVLVKDANGLPVPYPTLKWSIVDPVAYGGGKLSAGSSSGSSLTARYLSPEGEGWVSWAVGATREIFQQVSVEVVRVSRIDLINSNLIKSDVSVSSSGLTYFKCSNGYVDRRSEYAESCLGDWSVFYPSASSGEQQWGIRIESGGRWKLLNADGSIWTNPGALHYPNGYGSTWRVVRDGGNPDLYRLWVEGWMHPNFWGYSSDPLSIPSSRIDVYRPDGSFYMIMTR